MADWPLVKRGDRGPTVKVAQRLLIHGGATIAADGIFGPATEEAVKTHQDAKAVRVDGKIGHQTWPVLIVDIDRGDKGEAVRAAQELLVAHLAHEMELAVDGIFGPKTEEAARTFQEKEGLPVLGRIEARTWYRLITGSERQGDA